MSNDDPIDFSVIESHKENIQSLPSGRSAKALFTTLSPLSTSRPGATASPSDTNTLNNAIRAEYENELLAIDESDDPLDIYDRYVKWTINAYPSAQATAQSGLLPLLERATKSFLTSTHYKNDPRYLKLWLHYIRLFSDAPRETFAFLARHGVGETLALYYEEFGAWLEGAGRWAQAEEVFELGLQKEARPTERLVRKYREFKERWELQGGPETTGEGPQSPALPKVRAALAAKIDPFAAAAEREQAQQGGQQRASPSAAASGTSKRTGKQKMAIFSDADSPGGAEQPAVSKSSSGWESIGSMKDRRKENTVEAKPWAGETLKAGKRVGTVQKMAIFKDESMLSQIPDSESKPSSRSSGPPVTTPPHHERTVVNPRTGKMERVFVNLEAVYPDPEDLTVEFSFEELRAMKRGWFDVDWRKQAQKKAPLGESVVVKVNEPVYQEDDVPEDSFPSTPAAEEDEVDEYEDKENAVVEKLVKSVKQKMVIHQDDEEDLQRQQLEAQARAKKEAKARAKKMRTREVRNETQTIRTKLDSPTGRKMKKKASHNAEPTMTIHTRAATNEIYDIFNQDLQNGQQEDKDRTDSNFGSDDDDDYTSAGESTGHISATVSELGDETEVLRQRIANGGLDLDGDTTFARPGNWEDFTLSEVKASSQLGMTTEKLDRFLAKGDFKTDDEDSEREDGHTDHDDDENDNENEDEAEAEENHDDLTFESGKFSFGTGPKTPLEETQMTSMAASTGAQSEVDENEAFDSEHYDSESEAQDYKPRFVPIPPEGYEPPTGTYRDAAQIAHNRLPFMTPIVEKTESTMPPGTTVGERRAYLNAKTPSKPMSGSMTPPPQTPPSVTVTPVRNEIADLLLESPLSGVEDSPKRKAELSFVQKLERKTDLMDGTPPKKLCVWSDGDVVQAKTTESVDFFGEKLDMASKVSVITQVQEVQIKSEVRTKPIIDEVQCNPIQDDIRNTIMKNLQPPLSTYQGYFDHGSENAAHMPEIRRFVGKAGAAKKNRDSEKAMSTMVMPPVLKFDGAKRSYEVKRELGKGAFAPVYLAESREKEEETGDLIDVSIDSADKVDDASTEARGGLEAIKIEVPPCPWEFYIMRTLLSRLGGTTNPIADSLVKAHEMHVFADEGYLIEEYRDQGTLLDLVNLAKADAVASGAASAVHGLDEVLAMFFAIEAFKIVESMHSVGIMHGDLKPDNFLVRFDDTTDSLLNFKSSTSSLNGAGDDLSSAYSTSTTSSWRKKGLSLIDFGRSIDMTHFPKKIRFIADWQTSDHDCPEMRELRPWTYQIDMYGLAGTVHLCLFGKYVEVIGSGTGGGREYKLKEGLKRYWNRELWSEVFDLCLNSGCERWSSPSSPSTETDAATYPTPPSSFEDEKEESRVEVPEFYANPVLGSMKKVRGKMEAWLEENAEKRGLRNTVRRLEALIKEKRKGN